MAIVRGTQQLHYEARSWCGFYGCLKGMFTGWALAKPGWESAY